MRSHLVPFRSRLDPGPQALPRRWRRIHRQPSARVRCVGPKPVGGSPVGPLAGARSPRVASDPYKAEEPGRSMTLRSAEKSGSGIPGRPRVGSPAVQRGTSRALGPGFGGFRRNGLEDHVAFYGDGSLRRLALPTAEPMTSSARRPMPYGLGSDLVLRTRTKATRATAASPPAAPMRSRNRMR